MMKKEKNIPSKNNKNEIKECELRVDGMHCPSCEILIEKSILELEGVGAVDASTSSGKVLIEYSGEKPSLKKLNELFKKDGYSFKEKNIKELEDNKIEKNSAKEKINNFFVIAGASIFFIFGFLILHNSGIASIVGVNEKSALSMFFFFGLIAGFSSCAALVGGIVLSMSKQWMNNYSKSDSFISRAQPHFLFNSGRLVSYAFFGAILGGLGSFFSISLSFTAFLVIAVSIMMMFLALQMIGVKYFQKFQVSLPKFITRHIADEKNFQGKYMPFSMGALTFFLPCGFTITAQGLALASGSIWQGSLIMFLFALGTVPSLLAIGFSSLAFSKKPHIAGRFLKTAGVLVLFFAMFNINSQLVVLGYASIEDLGFNSDPKSGISSIEGLPPIVNGKQILKMDAFSYAYSPSNLVVRAGVPVRWEITDKGVSGCTNAIISRSLFEGDVPIVRGQTSVKEFTPKTPGKYKFSCWMGMVSGTIEVVDVDEKGAVLPSVNSFVESVQASSSSSSSCGGGSCGRGATNDNAVGSCGGGSGCGGSCGRGF